MVGWPYVLLLHRVGLNAWEGWGMNSDFLEALADLEKEKGIDKEILLGN